MKKSFYFYPTADGDIVVSGYPGWICHSDVYPFRTYTLFLDERSRDRIGEKSVSVNPVNLLSDENECEVEFPPETLSGQLMLDFTPWRR